MYLNVDLKTKIHTCDGFHVEFTDPRGPSDYAQIRKRQEKMKKLPRKFFFFNKTAVRRRSVCPRVPKRKFKVHGGKSYFNHNNQQESYLSFNLSF